MIEFKTGNIFKSNCDTIVNTVNCVGVMGAGIAKECKQRYPGMYEEYVRRCGTKLVHGGDLWFWYNPDFQMQTNIFAVPTKVNPNILCFATKEDWRDNSQLSWIERGLEKFVEEDITFISRFTGQEKTQKFWELHRWAMNSIAFPKLGCNNGKLRWEDVKPLMIKYLQDLPLKIEIYE